VEIPAPADHLERWVDVKDGSASSSSIQISPRVFAPNTTTLIKFGLPITAVVSLRIYDGTGNVVVTLVNRLNLQPGSYEVQWDASNAGSGVYIFELIYQGLGTDLQVNTGIFVDSRKLLLVK
jgi:hypothetical protein